VAGASQRWFLKLEEAGEWRVTEPLPIVVAAVSGAVVARTGASGTLSTNNREHKLFIYICGLLLNTLFSIRFMDGIAFLTTQINSNYHKFVSVR
jgi:hypothetical protein